MNRLYDNPHLRSTAPEAPGIEAIEEGVERCTQWFGEDRQNPVLVSKVPLANKLQAARTVREALDAVLAAETDFERSAAVYDLCTNPDFTNTAIAGNVLAHTVAAIDRDHAVGLFAHAVDDALISHAIDVLETTNTPLGDFLYNIWSLGQSVLDEG